MAKPWPAGGGGGGGGTGGEGGEETGAPGPGPVDRRLYVANDSGSIDVFDIDDNHKKLRSIKAPVQRARGITAHAGTARLYFSDSDGEYVAAMDLLTDEILWERTYKSCTFPDRLNVTMDGKAIYVPCKENDTHVILDPDTGAIIKTFPLSDRPHNTFTGEQGKYMYLSAFKNGTMLVVDPGTQALVREVGPFSSGVRPFSVNRDETRIFATLTELFGFAIADPETGKVLAEVEHQTPAERRNHPNADAGRPHGDEPFNHGLAVRPGKEAEIWFIDDAWGYLYAFDASVTPPRHLADVPLWTDIDEPWTDQHWRWVAFSIDGKYVYPGGEGIVVDADAKAMLPVRITPSEKLVEVQFSKITGLPVRVSGQNGGVYR